MTVYAIAIIAHAFAIIVNVTAVMRVHVIAITVVHAIVTTRVPAIATMRVLAIATMPAHVIATIVHACQIILVAVTVVVAAVHNI